jgi:hypothetical protein
MNMISVGYEKPSNNFSHFVMKVGGESMKL